MTIDLSGCEAEYPSLENLALITVKIGVAFASFVPLI